MGGNDGEWEKDVVGKGGNKHLLKQYCVYTQNFEIHALTSSVAYGEADNVV